MKKIIFEEYRVSGKKVTHMKLEKIELPESETASMLKRYRFDENGTEEMIQEIDRFSEEFDIRQEQKEYEEMNYSAIVRRLSKLSTKELLARLWESLK